MASSKKPRKKNNGQLIAIRQAQQVVKNLYISTVFDMENLNDESTVKNRIKYHNIDGRLINPSYRDLYLLRNLKHKWTIFTAILCRKQDGEMYIHNTKESFITEGECNLQDMASAAATELAESWNASNSLHLLTMMFVAIPQNAYSFNYKQILSPIYYSNAFEEFRTRYEIQNPEHEFLYYKAKDLNDFMYYFLNQKKVIQRETNLVRLKN